MGIYTTFIPVLWFCAYNLVAVSALRFPYPQRVWALPFILILAYRSFDTVRYLTQPADLDYAAGIAVIVQTMYMTAMLFLHHLRWTVTTTNIDESSQVIRFLHYLRSVYEISLNLRRLRVLNTRSFWRENRSNRRSFMLSRIFRRLVTWTVLETIARRLLILGFDDFSPQDFTNAENIWTARHMCLRIYFVLQWLSAQIILLEGTRAFCAFCFIYIFRLDAPWAWPDLFGDLKSAYTLSRFWRLYWHRLHLPAYIAWSEYLLQHIKHEFVENCLIKVLIFLMSGIAHALVSWKLGEVCGILDDVRFYMFNFAGMMLEASLSISWALIAHDKSFVSVREVNKPHWALRCVGHVWVFVFFVWAVPNWSFPQVYCNMLAAELK